MSFGELSRMSLIKDRNIYAQTDQLYQPLRNALRKSTVSQSLLFPQMNISKVGRQMRSLSPAETQMIKRNLYIPVNKQLVPSRNLHKIIGKNFTAVDVNETVKQALTPQQFSRRPHGTTQQIIYEIKDQPFRNNNIYTSRADLPTSIYRNPHTMRESKVVYQNNRETRINFNTAQQANKPIQSIEINQSQFNRQSPNIHHLRHSQANIVSSIDHFNVSNIYTQPQDYSLNLPNNTYSIKPQRQSLIAVDRSNQRVFSPYLRHETSKQNINKTITSVTALRNEINQGYTSPSQIKNHNESKLYDFRGSKASDKSTKNSRISKDEYKYNIFSAFDQAGNTNCRSGCFNSNQIVASKIQHNPWK